ncbi:MAG: hypothetical protein H0T45_10685, partial [Pyrinomonadaceae bacterium]|nr:hypothetical protein [Pyrinomonadaceae bacterium]
MSKETIEKDVTSQDGRGTTSHAHTETTIESSAAHDTPNGAEATEVKHVNSVVETVDATGGEQSIVETTTVERHKFSAPSNRRTGLIVALVAFVAIAALFFLWTRRQSDAKTETEAATAAATDADGHAAGEEHGTEEGGEVHLEPEALISAGLEYEGVT